MRPARPALCKAEAWDIGATRRDSIPVLGLYARNYASAEQSSGRNFNEATVDDIDNTVDGDACFGDVGGYNDFSLTLFGRLKDC